MTKRVLILSTRINGGGAEKVSTLMGESIDNSNLVVFENIGDFEYKGDSLINLNTPGYNNAILKIIAFAVRFIKIQYLKIIEKPRTTISHLEGPNFINLLTIFGGKKVIFVHNINSINYSIDGKFGLLKLRLMKLLYKRADLVIGVSDDICKELDSLFNVPVEKVMYLPNPIDVERVRARSKNNIQKVLGFLAGEEYIINVGSLTEQKGQKYFLQILKELKNIRLKIKGVILGDGILKKELVSYSNKLNLKCYVINSNNSCSAADADVIFVGFQNNPYPYLLHAKFFVMTSLWEGLPIALLESIALTTPVVVTDCSSGIKQALFKNNLEIEVSAPLKVSAGYIMPKINVNNFQEQLEMWTDVLSAVEECNAEHLKFRSQCQNLINEFELQSVLKLWLKNI